jgi:hypothetical protein
VTRNCVEGIELSIDRRTGRTWNSQQVEQHEKPLWKAEQTPIGDVDLMCVNRNLTRELEFLVKGTL